MAFGESPAEILIAINLEAAESIGYDIPFEFMLMADDIFLEVEIQ